MEQRGGTPEDVAEQAGSGGGGRGQERMALVAPTACEARLTVSAHGRRAQMQAASRRTRACGRSDEGGSAGTIAL